MRQFYTVSVAKVRFFGGAVEVLISGDQLGCELRAAWPVGWHEAGAFSWAFASRPLWVAGSLRSVSRRRQGGAAGTFGDPLPS